MKNCCTHSMDSRRRWLTASLGLPGLAWTGVLRAQAKAPVVIGWLNVSSRGSPPTALNAFHEGMASLGWQLGAQFVLEERHADGRVERLPVLAQELAATRPAVIVTSPSTAAIAAARAAPGTPIVLANGDPMASGLVTSLARPGGLVTGLSNVTGDLSQKVVELLVESLPKLQRIGFLADPTSPVHSGTVRDARHAAERLRVAAVFVDMAKPEDIEPAMARLAKDKVQALVILASQWFGPYQPKIMGLALAQRWPVVGNISLIPRQGGLLSYGADRTALFRRSAYDVDRILKGAKPGDLAIEQPTTFELVVNMKTAKTLGITFAPSILVRATEVIE